MIRNIVAADLDGDGNDEVVVLGSDGETPHVTSAELRVLTIRGGSLDVLAKTRWNDAEATQGFGLATGDVDGDGRVDIVTGGFAQSDATERGELGVWRLDGGELHATAKTTFTQGGWTSTRVNAVAVADLDGDGRAEIVTAGRHGMFRDKTREEGDLRVFALRGGSLAERSRRSWVRDGATRFRTVRILRSPGEGTALIAAGGQSMAESRRATLGVFRFAQGALDDGLETRTPGEEMKGGEIRDLFEVAGADGEHLVSAGSLERHAERIWVWRRAGDHLDLERVETAPTAAEEGEARGLVVWPTARGPLLLTVGHEQRQAHYAGEVLNWGRIM
jgi:hypothetical protein